MGLYVRHGSLEEVLHVARNLRKPDIQEVDALLALPPEAALRQAFYGSATPLKTMHDTATDEPVAVGNVEPVMNDEMIGTIWMLTTPKIEKQTREFLRLSASLLDTYHETFPILTNLVDARNTKHIRWLRWMGFSFLKRFEQWGARGVPFIEFARIDTNPCA